MAQHHVVAADRLMRHALTELLREVRAAGAGGDDHAAAGERSVRGLQTGRDAVADIDSEDPRANVRPAAGQKEREQIRDERLRVERVLVVGRIDAAGVAWAHGRGERTDLCRPDTLHRRPERALERQHGPVPVAVELPAVGVEGERAAPDDEVAHSRLLPQLGVDPLARSAECGQGARDALDLGRAGMREHPEKPRSEAEEA